MKKPIYISGPAGTGKTTLLLAKTAHYASTLVTEPHQRLLAMAYMHGARRRLDTSLELDEDCHQIPRLVSTIDSFALTLLNQWRTALGLELPICPAPSRCTQSYQRHDRWYLPFTEIAELAAKLLKHDTVLRIVAASFPLIVIDEFQDCTGAKLELIRALAAKSQLIIAADAYQLLDGAVDGCPAVEWIESLRNDGLHECHNLLKPQRYVNGKIFEAAQCLREQKSPINETIPIFQGQFRPVAFRIMERLQLGWNGPCWTGTTAIISPSVGGVVEDLLRSLAEQSTKRGHQPIKWRRQNASDAEEAGLYKALGVSSDHLDETGWDSQLAKTERHTTEVMELTRRFAHLRGLSTIPKYLVSSIAGRVIHTARSRGPRSDRFVVTTIHGAKNCEYDNVIIIWSYQVPPGRELQSRLLYNAVTRAKKNCVVFDTRQQKISLADEILALIGTPKPVFEKKKKSSTALLKRRTSSK